MVLKYSQSLCPLIFRISNINLFDHGNSILNETNPIYSSICLLILLTKADFYFRLRRINHFSKCRSIRLIDQGRLYFDSNDTNSIYPNILSINSIDQGKLLFSLKDFQPIFLLYFLINSMSNLDLNYYLNLTLNSNKGDSELNNQTLNYK
jgi:hypothetical protein